MERYYTSIEQSLHLHDLGLPQDTADMVYRNDYDVYTEENYICEIPEILPFEGDFLKNDVPCWSLGALLKLMPKGSHIEANKCYVVYNKPFSEANTIIDAAYNAMCWLIEKGYIK